MTSLDQLTSNLLKSIRKGHKQYKAKVREQEIKSSQSHSWHFGHCLDCGISVYDSKSDKCTGK